MAEQNSYGISVGKGQNSGETTLREYYNAKYYKIKATQQIAFEMPEANIKDPGGYDLKAHTGDLGTTPGFELAAMMEQEAWDHFLEYPYANIVGDSSETVPARAKRIFEKTMFRKPGKTFL